MVASRSSHMIEIACRFGELKGWPSCTPDVGCTPSSLRPVPKISHSAGSAPPVPAPVPASPASPSDTNGHCSTSLKKARVAVASSEYTRVWMAVIMAATLAPHRS